MFGMSFVELSIVAIIALLLLGPDQLPGVARTIGKGLRDLRKASDDLKSTFNQELVKLESEIEAPPKPRRAAINAATNAANAVIETAQSATSGLPEPVLGAGLLSLDQARQAAAPIPPVDPGALRAQARAYAIAVDPGAARAAARSLAAHPPVPPIASDGSIHAENTGLLIEAKAANIEAKIHVAAAQAELNTLEAAAEPSAPSGAIYPGNPVDIANASALTMPQAPAPLPPEEELKPLRTYVNNAPVFTPGPPPATIARKKPDEP